MDMVYSNKGGLLMICDDHLFEYHCRRPGYNTYVWKCIEAQRQKCQARFQVSVREYPHSDYKSFNILKHTHHPCPAKIARRLLLAKIKECAVKYENVPEEKIVEKFVARHSLSFNSDDCPSEDVMLTAIRSARKKSSLQTLFYIQTPKETNSLDFSDESFTSQAVKKEDVRNRTFEKRSATERNRTPSPIFTVPRKWPPIYTEKLLLSIRAHRFLDIDDNENRQESSLSLDPNDKPRTFLEFDPPRKRKKVLFRVVNSQQQCLYDMPRREQNRTFGVTQPLAIGSRRGFSSLRAVLPSASIAYKKKVIQGMALRKPSATEQTQTSLTATEISIRKLTLNALTDSNFDDIENEQESSNNMNSNNKPSTSKAVGKEDVQSKASTVQTSTEFLTSVFVDPEMAWAIKYLDNLTGREFDDYNIQELSDSLSFSDKSSTSKAVGKEDVQSKASTVQTSTERTQTLSSIFKVVPRKRPLQATTNRPLQSFIANKQQRVTDSTDPTALQKQIDESSFEFDDNENLRESSDNRYSYDKPSTSKAIRKRKKIKKENDEES
ncbi:hypothetical protein M3Y94_00873400 [Aphelenchoides besseyi]|nr:hypothetical protein M3Y94_00873400 [Aphelenchoides besseyi]KAI6226628.1 hypothetical protein M3Y95_00640700 [Aphelenchoides besseyi]